MSPARESESAPRPGSRSEPNPSPANHDLDRAPDLVDPFLLGDAREEVESPFTSVGLGALAAPLDEDEPPKGWHGSVNFGFTQVKGNTDTQSVNLHADATKEVGGLHRYTGRAHWNYGEVDREISERNAGINLQYDYLAGEKHYYFLTAVGETDSQANLDLRYYGGGGIGYQFKETEDLDYAADAGLVYIKEEYDVPPPADDENDSVALRLAHNLEYRFNENTRFIQFLDLVPAVDDLKDVYGTLDSRLETKLNDSLVASVQYVLGWDNTPAPGSRNKDHRVVVSIGWSFGS